MHRCIRERNEELAKPAEQRDAARLLQLTKRVLTMRLEFSQARAEQLRLDARLIAHYRDLGCCGDCVRVRLRIAASLRAQAAWYEEWAVIYALRLQAVEQGHPKPPLVLPHLDVQPYLAEGVPAELPASSIDRCAACQKELDKTLNQELEVMVQVDYEP